MNNLLTYLLSVSFGTTLLYLCYLLLFRKDTFYNRNRILLILILLLPMVFPAIKIPVVSVIESPGGQAILANNLTPAETPIIPTIPAEVESFNYNRLIAQIYFTITALLILRIIISLIRTYMIIRKGEVKCGQFPKVIVSELAIPPFSFFPYAVIPAEDYKRGNYNDLINHEFAHIRQGHTFDLLLCELFIAFQWFNPVIWLIKRSVLLNHEYLADRVTIRNNKSAKEYQYRLLNFRSGLKTLKLAHSFNSLIKNRIVMINKKPTRKFATLKTLLMIPLVVCLLYACATPLKTRSHIVIENPEYASSNVPYLFINKIELTDSSTVLHFQVSFTPGWWIDIPSTTYIKPVNGINKSFVRSAVGIPLGENHYMPESGEISFKLVFPEISDQVDRIDFGQSSWHVNGIVLKPRVSKKLVPKDLLGNWYNRISGLWELSFLETFAVYKKQLWNYDNINLKSGKGSVTLNNDTSTVTLFTKTEKNGSLLTGESPRELTAYEKEVPEQVENNSDDKPFGIPVFREESATYSGFFAGYNPVTSGKSFILYFNDIISGEKNAFSVNISENGYFSTKIPAYYPHIWHIESPAYRGSVFLEPGKDVFQRINRGTENSVFMGESAKINSDLVLLKNINSFDYNEMRRTINSMSPEMYKTYCLNSMKKDLNTLDSITKAKSICAKAFQIKKMDIEYIYASHIMDYDWYFKSAYREQHNIRNTQKELPVKPEVITADYYDFLTDDLVNNPIGFMSDNYNAFMHSFKNIALIQTNKAIPSVSDFVLAFEKAGYPFNEEEKRLAEALKKKETQDFLTAHSLFLEKYKTEYRGFYTKYGDKILDINKEHEGVNVPISMYEKYLTDKGVRFTDKEKAFLTLLKANEGSEAFIKYNEFSRTYGKALENFSNKYSGSVNSVSAQYASLEKKENLNILLGVGQCMATEIMLAQEQYLAISKSMTPFNEIELRNIQQQISTPFIAEYFNFYNDKLKARIESNKKKPGYSVNAVPVTKTELLFDSILSKYRGKVVFVDFWATWCSPCLSGIAQMKPLKEEMADQNVVFLYISGPSSPPETWANMIPDIKGEHYRVSADEWKYLTEKFNITGIPHYMLVDSLGVVVNSKMNQMSNELLKLKLEEYIKE